MKSLVSVSFIEPSYQKCLTFREAKTCDDIDKIYAFRLKMYAKLKSYMLTQLDSSGYDNLDDNSKLYMACLEDEIIATVRLRTYPFEITRFLSEGMLHEFLGVDFKKNYLEWSRLVADSSHRIRTLVPNLLTYVGLHSLANSSYFRYFGYTIPCMRRLLAQFNFIGDQQPFAIPDRQQKNYYLLKGNFKHNLQSLL